MLSIVLGTIMTLPMQAAAEGQITIRFSWWGGEARHQATLAALDLFMQKYPNITVEPEYQGYDGYHEKLFAQLAGGTAPDLFQFSPQSLPDVTAAGLLAPLEPFVNDGVLNLDEVSPVSLSSTTIDGVLYAVPMSIQTFCVIYNKTLFDQAGIAYPADDWTWDDFDRIVAEFQGKLPDGVYATDDMRIADVTTMMMVHQQGGAYLTPDGQLNFQEYISWPLEKFQKLMQDGITPPYDELVAMTRDRFVMEGKVAMASQFSAMAVTLQEGALPGNEFALTTIPGSNTGDFLGNIAKGELGFCVNAKSPNAKEAAMLLNEFINNLDMAKTLRLVRGLPPSEAVQEMLSADMTPLERDVIKVQKNRREYKGCARATGHEGLG